LPKQPCSSGVRPARRLPRATARPGWRWRSKLNEAASERWRYVSSPRLATLVRADAKSGKRVLIERPDEAESKVAA
jgi:hypothetical protein